MKRKIILAVLAVCCATAAAAVPAVAEWYAKRERNPFTGVEVADMGGEAEGWSSSVFVGCSMEDYLSITLGSTFAIPRGLEEGDPVDIDVIVDGTRFAPIPAEIYLTRVGTMGVRSKIAGREAVWKLLAALGSARRQAAFRVNPIPGYITTDVRGTTHAAYIVRGTCGAGSLRQLMPHR